MESYLDTIIRSPEFFGIARYCNICGYRFAKFSQFNQMFPREAQCPVCGSLERHRHIYTHILSMFPFLDGKKVLHFAPERVLKEIFLSSRAEYYDADYDPQKATYRVDITDIPFEENTFDYIFAFHVLEHIPDDIKAMNELYRVLKPAGTAYLSVPLRMSLREDLSITDPEERTRLFGQHDHVRYYDLKTFTERLDAAGFDTEMISDPAAFPKILDQAKFSDKIVFARKI